ncbi:MAG TPA: glycosyltransferase family A protein [Polyangiales bacterium]
MTDLDARQLSRIGVVAIGRNEGERLRRCFDSLPAGLGLVVYVDSGSSDGSVELARARGHEVVELDMSRPFTAARARNAGFQRLSERQPDVPLVLFVDGDCAVAPGFFHAAAAVLDDDPAVVAVWGRRREAHPEHSVYNRMCDLEWSQVPAGEASSFGGDVLVRCAAVREVGGYDPRIIAGEDPEFALRLRHKGHRIVRVDAEMTLHDADITSFRQWWIRARRSGYAYAQVSALHGAPPERFWVKDKRRALAWGGALPLLAAAFALPTVGLSLLPLGLYPVRFARIASHARRRGLPVLDAGVWALHCSGACVPQTLGIAQYYLQRLRGTDPTIIEYKHGA